METELIQDEGIEITNSTDRKAPKRLSPYQARLYDVLRIKPKPEERELVERAFAGNEDLRKHIERILTLDMASVIKMRNALQDRRDRLPPDKDLGQRLVAIDNVLTQMGYNPNELPQEIDRDKADQLPLMPLEVMRLGEAWDTITLRPKILPGKTEPERGAVIAEINFSLKTWWNRIKDINEPASEEERQAFDPGRYAFLSQIYAFLETYFAYQTNGISDTPGTITIELDEDQKDKLRKLLEEQGRLSNAETPEEAAKYPLTLVREQIDDPRKVNSAIDIERIMRKPKMAFWHGWAGNRKIGNLLARQHYPIAFVSFDAMGSGGNRHEGALQGLRDPNEIFSLYDYARQQYYVREIMFCPGDVIRGWSMGAEALALSLVLQMKQLKEQLGKQLCPELLDGLVKEGKLMPIIHVAEARATANRETGITSCDFLEPNPNESLPEQLKSLQAATLIRLGHILFVQGIAELPGLNEVVQLLTNYQAGQLLPHDTNLRQEVLGYHTGNLMKPAENQNVSRQTNAILGYRGMSEEEMWLLQLAKHLHPVIEVIGAKDLLTDPEVQKSVNAQEARVALNHGLYPTPIISYPDGHSLMVGKYLSFPHEALMHLERNDISLIFTYLRILAKQRAEPPIPLDRYESEVWRNCNDPKLQPNAGGLVSNKKDPKEQPLGYRIAQSMINRSDPLVGLLTAYVPERKKWPYMLTLAAYLMNQNVCYPLDTMREAANSTPLSARVRTS